MSNTSFTYLLAALVGVTSLSLWTWLVLVPAYTAYARVWQKVVAVVMSVYVLAAFVGMGACVGAAFLYYYDRL